MIIDHNNKTYRRIHSLSGVNKYNGAYYYSKEIVRNIIPRVETDRNWVTVRVENEAFDHSVVFIHNNKETDCYEYLRNYKDLILVCGIPETMDKVKHLGTPIYVPLSIDVAEVSKYRCEKTKDVAYAGRPSKRQGKLWDVDHIEGVRREMMLQQMAQYRYVYAVGRSAIEARCLGCEILRYDPRYPDVSIWKVIDNSEAAQILQNELDKIDG